MPPSRSLPMDPPELSFVNSIKVCQFYRARSKWHEMLSWYTLENKAERTTYKNGLWATCGRGGGVFSPPHNGNLLVHRCPWWLKTAFPSSSVFWSEKDINSDYENIIWNSVLDSVTFKMSRLRNVSLLRRKSNNSTSFTLCAPNFLGDGGKRLLWFHKFGLLQ